MLPAQPRTLISSYPPCSLNYMPEALKTLFTSENVKTITDAFVLALHAFMLEVGFLPNDVPEQEHLEVLPKAWNDNMIYKIRYHHLTCPEIGCLMACVPLGNLINIFGILHDDAICFKDPNFSMRISDHVNSSHEFSDPTLAYKDLKLFSQIFKDNFAFTFVASLQDALGFGPTFGISKLMEHLKIQILSYLPVHSLIAMSATNKEFHELANSTSLWKNLYLNDFPTVIDSSIKTRDWKKLYETEYLKLKRMHQMALTPSYPHPASFFPNLHGSHYPLDIHNNEPRIRIFPSPLEEIPPEIRSAFPELASRLADFP